MNNLNQSIDFFGTLRSTFDEKSYKITFFDKMKYEVNRLSSFYLNTWPISNISPYSLASNGLFYLSADRVQCAFCRGTLNHWKIGHRPSSEHAKLFPLCPFLLKENVGNVPIQISQLNYSKNLVGKDVCGNSNNQTENRTLEINKSKNIEEFGAYLHTGPKYPEYCTINARKKTFLNDYWKNKKPVNPDRLSEAGFFSLNHLDIVCCFYCKGILSFWEPDDDPWIEHQNWFPDCEFVKLNFSEKNLKYNYQSDFNNNNENIIEKKFSKRNFEENTIKFESSISFNGSKDKLNEATENLKNNKDIYINESILCKICSDKEIGVVFLPCGHQLACTQCSSWFFNCPVCRKTIKATVKTYFS